MRHIVCDSGISRQIFRKGAGLFRKVYSGGLRGLEGYRVQVEADISDGLPGFHMVGYLASEVREAEYRVRTAMKNSGFMLHPMRVTVNLSPADVRKDGTGFDLPIAIAVLAAYGIIEPMMLKHAAFIGELGLDGQIKPVRGILPLVLALRSQGIRRCYLPVDNTAEGLAVEQMEIAAVSSLKALVEALNRPEDIMLSVRQEADLPEPGNTGAVDFGEVSGQYLARRATEIAVAGQHNILYLGPPGSGKSMIAQRIPTIMPDMSPEEQLELSKIYSVCGMLPPGSALVRNRPFRAPHHTISPQALTGGGNNPKPGELSLAARGVLFLDELPEFRKVALEVLRQPLEEHKVMISRVHGAYEFPADCMLAAAMNPCPCGYYPDRNRCSCTAGQVQKYLGRISRPLLDRIDICVEVSPITYTDIRNAGENEPSALIRERVENAREIQKKRFSGTPIFFNSEMKNQDIRRFCVLGDKEEEFLKCIFEKMQLTARGCHKILKVARTIADLEGKERIARSHLSEATGYRELENKYWGKVR